MTSGSDKSLRFYCPSHRIRFQAAGQAVISCEQGGHTVAAGFPSNSWYEFCCDCGTFWPTDSAGGSLQRSECLVCERPLVKRFLCNKCQVVSIESSALVRRKTYSIQDSGITPDCPGCGTAAPGRLHEHDCGEAKVRLLTARQTCPFCETHLEAKNFSKAAPGETARVAVCPSCQMPQKPDNIFCGHCGKSLAAAVAPAKAKEPARRNSEKTAGRSKTTETLQQATTEALRVVEKQRRREPTVKEKAEGERIGPTAQQTGARDTGIMTAAIEAGKKAYQQERHRAQLAEAASKWTGEGRRRPNESQRRAEEEAVKQAAEKEARLSAQRKRKAEEARALAEQEQQRLRESHRRAQEEAARQAAEREARLIAERKRKAEEARALAEQERQRLEEAQRQQIEHERLAAELHQRAKDEEARRAREAAAAHPNQHNLKTPEVEPSTEVEDETPSDAAPENLAESDKYQLASASEHLAGEAARELVAQQLSQQTSGPNRGSIIDAPKPSHNDDSSDESVANEVVKAAEYVPSWDQPSIFTAPQGQRVPQVWLIRLVVLVVIGVVLTVIVMKQRVNTNDNASARLTPTPTAPIVPAGMVFIPGGEIALGSDRSNADQQEKPAHNVTIAPFYIDTTEVTCEEYQKFVKATGHKAPAQWVNGNCAIADMRKPVTGVDWYDANAYAKWANKRLPTEEEWEFAARGTTGWIYPWGDVWRKGDANADNAASGVVVVATFKGTSPFQCYDMVGNAWEWTASKLVPYPGGKLAQKTSDGLRVIRGGSWESDSGSATTTYRFGWPARGGDDYNNTGFRCAVDAKAARSER